MAVLKNYVEDNSSTTDKIITLDEKYDSYLQEAAQHKSRAKQVKESFKRDVYTAKQGQAVSKMKTIKREIKSLI
jgi:seryl-tRNA synthetase